MKITLNTNYIPPYRDMKKPAGHTMGTTKASRNFDEITIHSTANLSEDKLFADSLSNRLLLEVKQPVSKEKIREIQEQIDQGTYEVDLNSIVDKIMLY